MHKNIIDYSANDLWFMLYVYVYLIHCQWLITIYDILKITAYFYYYSVTIIIFIIFMLKIIGTIMNHNHTKFTLLTLLKNLMINSVTLLEYNYNCLKRIDIFS